MIPKSIHTNENITKIPTPNSISPYLQAISINNKPLIPIFIINMYMPTHPQDTHLIVEIQIQIPKLITQHPKHQTILAGDFNRDILLRGRTTDCILSPPNQADHEWAQFTQKVGLHVINNHNNFTRQGGHNYTSTSLIDGFYSNSPGHNNLQNHTVTHLNQNSDHYPILLQLPPNIIITKRTTNPTYAPWIIYPISPANLQKLHTMFLDK